MRKGWDSNPRTALDGHTLSRRANSTALAPFQIILQFQYNGIFNKSKKLKIFV